MTAFCFYAEPAFIVGNEGDENRSLFVGLGDNHGTEVVALGVNYECEQSVIQLNANELRELIVHLGIILAIMTEPAS
jgi:hypothetical protein